MIFRLTTRHAKESGLDERKGKHFEPLKERECFQITVPGVAGFLGLKQGPGTKSWVRRVSQYSWCAVCGVLVVRCNGFPKLARNQSKPTFSAEGRCLSTSKNLAPCKMLASQQSFWPGTEQEMTYLACQHKTPQPCCHSDRSIKPLPWFALTRK